MVYISLEDQGENIKVYLSKTTTEIVDWIQLLQIHVLQC